MSQRFQFTREEIAAELQRCGYSLTTEEEVERFENDLAALYAEANFRNTGDDSNYCPQDDNFYDLPILKDDIDFSRYYKNSKGVSASDDVVTSKQETSSRIKSLIKNPPKLAPIPSKYVPSSSRHETKSTNSQNPNVSIASSTTNTKRKVLRKSDDGSSYIDELLFGRTLPTTAKRYDNLPLVLDNNSGDEEYDTEDFDRLRAVDYNQPIEDKISRLTLLSGRPGSADSPAMSHRSFDGRSGMRRSGESPLRLSDRDNRQSGSGKTRTTTSGSTAGSMSHGGALPSVIARPLQIGSGKGKRVTAQDPVTRYAEYSKAWKSQKAPGEKQHKELRWQIRGQMLARDDTIFIGGRRTVASASAVAPKPIPKQNNYVIPTEKKRQALRWAIRSALATGRQPPTSTRYVNRAFMSG